ncbi:MAG: hypothetical protein KAG84_04405 [Bacteroidales bacterium]|nr:hypothetical protein [Bacteroidales bacterium]
MPKSYTNQFYTPTEFNTNATDAEILFIANRAAEKGYKVDDAIIDNIYLHSTSFENLGLSSSVNVYIN